MFSTKTFALLVGTGVAARSLLASTSVLTSTCLPHRRALSSAKTLPPTPNLQFIKHAAITPEYNMRTAEEIWKRRSKEALDAAERQPPADAYAGRSVKVYGGKVADAIRTVETILGRNKVRYYARLRQRHEKRSDKLQRLRSERWRKQFAAAVRQKAHLVTKIRSRGA